MNLTIHEHGIILPLFRHSCILFSNVSLFSLLRSCIILSNLFPTAHWLNRNAPKMPPWRMMSRTGVWWVSFCFQFAKSIYHKWVLNFLKCLFGIYVFSFLICIFVSWLYCNKVYKLGDNTIEIYCLRVWTLDIWNHGVNRAMLSLRPAGEESFASCIWWLQAFFGLCSKTPIFVSVFTWLPSLCVCVFIRSSLLVSSQCLLIRTLVILHSHFFFLSKL